MSEENNDIAVEGIAEGMGERIAARRQQLGWTQEKTAENAGLSHQFFSSVEGGRKNMRADNAVKLAYALQTSTDYILTGKRNSNDFEYIASMLRELDDEQLRHAEEMIKHLVAACKRAK
ncbi:MAG: helix-turn-helix domain-containing protein [Christensenellales bacterium]